MAVHPHKKRTKAQVAAERKWAAAGRAAQAKARKAGKQHQTKRQVAAARQNLVKARAAQAARRAGKKPPAPAKKPAAVVDYPDLRVLADPDESHSHGLHVYPVCAAVAVAAHLEAFTGIIAREDEILKLHDEAGLLALTDLLGYLHAEGFAGARLRSFRRADEELLIPGWIYGLQVSTGYHAVLARPEGIASWDMVLPWPGAPAEAWHLEWEDPVAYGTSSSTGKLAGQVGQGGKGPDPDIPECPVCYAYGGGGHGGFCPNMSQDPRDWVSEPPPGFARPQRRQHPCLT